MILSSSEQKIPLFASTNVNHAISKMDFIRSFISSKALQIFAATESWFSDVIPDILVNVNNNFVFRDDRDDGRVGGGVAVWTNFSLNPVRFYPDGPSYGTNSVWLTLPRLNMIFVCIYIPPSSSIKYPSEVVSFISNNLDSFLTSHPDSDIILTGDFNRLDVSYVLHAFDLIDLIKSPTRGDAILDHVFVSSPLENLCNVDVGPPISSSDHKTILCTPNKHSSTQSKTMRTVCDLRESNIQAFISTLEYIDFTLLYDSNLTIDEKCFIFNDAVKFCFDQTIPMTTVAMSPNDKPYVSPLIKVLINERWRAMHIVVVIIQSTNTSA